MSNRQELIKEIAEMKQKEIDQWSEVLPDTYLGVHTDEDRREELPYEDYEVRNAILAFIEA